MPTIAPFLEEPRDLLLIEGVTITCHRDLTDGRSDPEVDFDATTGVVREKIFLIG